MLRVLRDRRNAVLNRIETSVTTKHPGFWRMVHRMPPVHRRVNGRLITRAIVKIPTRPNPLSTMAEYPSWTSLTDRRYSGRHLPPAPPRARDLPPAGEVAALFKRTGEMTPCPKSTVLFPYFAAWFVDGFLRSERPRRDPVTGTVLLDASGEPLRDPAKNDSNHEIDLMQIYGLDARVTQALRAEEDGLLAYQTLEGEEYPPYLYAGGRKLFDPVTVVREDDFKDRRPQLFAFGGDTGNLQHGFVLMGVLFFREHNRIARSLRREYGWNDERTFQTARNILTVLLIKIVVEEYINHISPYHLRFLADPTVFRNPPWYRQNWMAVEFNLLYRWHSMVPSSFRIGDRDVPICDTLFNTDTVVERGLGRCFEDASRQTAGRVGLLNSPPEVLKAELASIRQARAVRLRSYNEYRSLACFPRARRFEHITSDSRVREKLRDCYGRVDEVEFYPGLFAEDVRPNSVLPPLIGRMVAIDAFSQAFTNPLLAPRLFNEKTFSPLGMRLIASTRSLSDLLHRNVPASDRRFLVTLTRPEWQRVV